MSIRNKIWFDPLTRGIDSTAQNKNVLPNVSLLPFSDMDISTKNICQADGWFSEKIDHGNNNFYRIHDVYKLHDKTQFLIKKRYINISCRKWLIYFNFALSRFYLHATTQKYKASKNKKNKVTWKKKLRDNIIHLQFWLYRVQNGRMHI